MDKSHLLSTLMVVRSLDMKKDLFHPQEGNEEVVGLKVSYLRMCLYGVFSNFRKFKIQRNLNALI